MRGDAVVSTHATRDEALEAALAANGLAPRDGIFRAEDGKPNGVVRWLSASTPEMAVDEDGKPVEIDRDSLIEAAADLNASPAPIPMDGGEGSRVHGSSDTGGNELANGWGQHGVMFERASGTPHLMLRSELLPDLAADTDTGRRAFGSIDIRFDRKATQAAGGKARGVVWKSHAITNMPMNKRLMPSTARAQGAESTESGRVLAPLTRINMSTKKIERAPKAPPPAPPATPPKSEVKQADPPAPPAPPADPGADAQEDTDLAAKVAQLEALVQALMAKLNATVDAAPDPEALAMAAVDKAIAEGRILAADKDLFLPVARLGVPGFEKMTATLRAYPGKASPLAGAVKRAEAKPRQAEIKPEDIVIDESDDLVRTMRAAKVGNAGIRKALAERGRVEV